MGNSVAGGESTTSPSIRTVNVSGSTNPKTTSWSPAARAMLHHRFRIEHCTLQIERTHLEDTRC